MTRRIFPRTREYLQVLREDAPLPDVNRLVEASADNESNERGFSLRSRIPLFIFFEAMALTSPTERRRPLGPVVGHAIYRIIKAFNALDDKLEAVPPEQLARLHTIQGIELHPYIEQILTPETIMAIKGVGALELITSFDELCSLCNIALGFIVEEAKAIVELRESLDSMNVRERVVKAHMDATCVYVAVLVNLIRRDVRVQERVNTLTFNDLEEIYPAAFRFARSGQLLDDLRDWIRDYTNDAESLGQNYTSQHSNSALLIFRQNGVTDTDLRRFVEDYRKLANKDLRSIPDQIMPASMRRAMSAFKAAYDAAHAGEGRLSQKMYDMWFTDYQRKGFSIEKRRVRSR